VQAIRDFVVIKIDILYVYVYMCVCVCVCATDLLSITRIKHLTF